MLTITTIDGKEINLKNGNSYLVYDPTGKELAELKVDSGGAGYINYLSDKAINISALAVNDKGDLVYDEGKESDNVASINPDTGHHTTCLGVGAPEEKDIELIISLFEKLEI